MVELSGCFITTSPGRSCVALSNIFGNSRCMFSLVASDIRGSICWHTVYIESRILWWRAVFTWCLQVKKWSPNLSMEFPQVHVVGGGGCNGSRSLRWR